MYNLGKMRLSLFFLFLILTSTPLIAELSISIESSPSLEKEPVSKIAIEDVKNLLAESCMCEVGFNNTDADVLLRLPSDITKTPFSTIEHIYTKDSVPTFYYPEIYFKWNSQKLDKQILLTLETDSYEGVAAALYALLQEKLGFRFYHPRETIIPSFKEWELEDNWEWNVKERFNKRGFHLHTMHPLELTEALLDEDFPNGMEQLKEYIDWLARNGQNYFEFNLLSTAKMKTWIPYISELVEYAHHRGIIMGIDISLNMIQQKAFKLYKRFPKSFQSKRKQIIKNLDILSEADFDVYNIEMSSTEYSSGNSDKRHQRMRLILDWAKEEEAKIMGRAHVVKKGENVLNYTGEHQAVYDGERGVMIHTVMFYEINDEKAPVYGSPNLKHMYDLLKKEQIQRETWYFPESAYWVTFDNSVPMFLLPYLSARWTDIQEMEQEGVEGHLTFSSGWEWGYWMVDWCIARWSWDYNNGQHEMDAAELLVDKNTQTAFTELHRIQDYYFKEKELMRYLVAQSVLDEVPKKFSKEFHPRPRWRYPYLFKKASLEELDSFHQEGIQVLDDFIIEYETALDVFNQSVSSNQDIVSHEWKDGLEITLLRAKHRAAILKAIYYHRKGKLDKKKGKSYLSWVDKASQIRMQALKIVERREAAYRYDRTLLSSKRKGHTAYHFGYLYPVHELHFWKREEEQVRRNKWGFPFMNIWNIWRIMGVI